MAGRSLLRRLGRADWLLRYNSCHGGRSRPDPVVKSCQPARKCAGGISCRLAGNFRSTRGLIRERKTNDETGSGYSSRLRRTKNIRE